MLFQLVDNFSRLRPVPFANFSQTARTEKQLEDLLAAHLVDTLFQQTPLLPFHQEKPWQGVADIYALNQHGDVIIFELKRDQADTGALDQLLRYASEAGLWGYAEIERRYRAYTSSDSSVSLKTAHRVAFNLEEAQELHESQFNREQHLWVVGSAADELLVRKLDYWKTKGLSIDFFPYRVYRLHDEVFFEFFAKPYDRHINPALVKGVLFDTNRSWDYLPERSGCLMDMLMKRRVAAYGDRKEAVGCFQPGDYVFLWHPGYGLVSAGRVSGRQIRKTAHQEYEEEWYWDIDILTRIPALHEFASPPAMTKAEVEGLVGHGFFWARIDKRPYLSREESERLLEELRLVLESRAMKSRTGPSSSSAAGQEGEPPQPNPPMQPPAEPVSCMGHVDMIGTTTACAKEASQN